MVKFIHQTTQGHISSDLKISKESGITAFWAPVPTFDYVLCRKFFPYIKQKFLLWPLVSVTSSLFIVHPCEVWLHPLYNHPLDNWRQQLDMPTVFLSLERLNPAVLAPLMHPIPWPSWLLAAGVITICWSFFLIVGPQTRHTTPHVASQVVNESDESLRWIYRLILR